METNPISGSKNISIYCICLKSVKIATQAENLNSQWRIWRLEARIWATPGGGFEANSQWRIWAKLALIVMTDKLMVKMKNLFWLKDGQGPCLDDVSIEQHLPLCDEL
jgi:hypothetical protein